MKYSYTIRLCLIRLHGKNLSNSFKLFYTENTTLKAVFSILL